MAGQHSRAAAIAVGGQTVLNLDMGTLHHRSRRARSTGPRHETAPGAPEPWDLVRVDREETEFEDVHRVRTASLRTSRTQEVSRGTCPASSAAEEGRFRIKRVFTNSVVLGVDQRGQELVLLGRGLGFQGCVGDVVDERLVEKTFVAEGSDTAERIAAFVDEISIEDIEVTEEIVRAGQIALGPYITNRMLIPLADHISFALLRAREGASIEYPLRWEVSYLYPAEVAFSRAALRIIERRRGIALPPLEAIPIALRFVNAQFGSPEMSTTMRMTEVLTQALAIIRDDFRIEIDDDSVTVARFVTDLRYLFLRESQGAQLPGIAIELHHAVQAAQPREYGCALRIAALLDEHFDWQVNDDELLYLSLHVARLTAGAVRTEVGHVAAEAVMGAAGRSEL